MVSAHIWLIDTLSLLVLSENDQDDTLSVKERFGMQNEALVTSQFDFHSDLIYNLTLITLKVLN